MSMRNRSRVGARAARALAALGVVLGAACGRDGRAAVEEAPSSVGVSPQNVAVVALQEIRSGPTISGTLRADQEAQVRSEASGTVVEVLAQQGQAVTRGQLLARIEGGTAEQALLSARAGVAAAERNLQQAGREAERVQSLVGAGALAERDLENARNAVAGAQAQLAAARAQLSLAERQVRNTQVRSPISGIVSARPVNAGDVVAPGAALFTVVNPAGMELEASVPSEWLAQVQVGAPVTFTVTGYPGRTFAGRVERVNPTADPVTRQVPIFVAIPNPGGQLVSGLFAQGRVAAEVRQGLVVPAAAVDRSTGTPEVLRLQGGVAQRVPVQVGLVDSSSETVEIVSGVAAGDTLLTGAALGISPGTAVRVAAPADR